MHKVLPSYTQQNLMQFKQELHSELDRLNHYWLDCIVSGDDFFSCVSSEGEIKKEADKGVILCTRMLWYFSEAAAYLDEEKLIQAASTLYQYLSKHFIDREHGGVVWSVDARGCFTNGRKQVYAQAFAVYSLSAYYRLTGNLSALESARSIYSLLEKYAFDRENGGYFEAFSREWGVLDDVRLSDKDLASPKTMNTHLHLIEAYTGLLLAEKKAKSEAHISALADTLLHLLDAYSTRFYNAENAHLRMFLSANWEDESQAISFGHDIESSWLMWEAAEILGNERFKQKSRIQVDALVNSCQREGLAEDGSVYDLFDCTNSTLIKERVWWVQAEAMVGFFNAWELNASDEHLARVWAIWDFIKKEFIDLEGGEWHWLAECDQTAFYDEYKVGPWKGPYHNGRALIELCQRIDKQLQTF